MTISALTISLWAFLAWSGDDQSTDSGKAVERDDIHIQLMTSLPIVWGEQASMENVITGKSSPAPIYQHWQDRYLIAPVDSFEGLEASQTDIVIMAQPNAMAPADIAALDSWIREGGNAIILTDPKLVWPTHLPIGDKRRPLGSSLLSPLLRHWGLELLAPDEAGAGKVELQFADVTISTIGIGTFEPHQSSGATDVKCDFSTANVIARCQVGKGRAILIADADFLREDLTDGEIAGLDAEDTKSRDKAAYLTDLLIAELQN